MENLLFLSFFDTETLCDFLCVLYLYWKVHFINGEQEPLMSCLQPRSSRPINFLFHNLRVPESKCRKSDADSENCHRKPHRKPFLCICAENVCTNLNCTKGKCTSHICSGRIPWCHSCSQDPLD
jgi:hypothetical protein